MTALRTLLLGLLATLPLPALAEDLPDLPASHILDTSRFFEEAREAALSQKLLQLAEEKNIFVYAVSSTSMISLTPDQYAEQLYQHWIEPTGRNGVIVLYVRGEHKLSFGAAEKLEEFLPRFELERIFRTASVAARQQERVADRLESAVTVVAEEFFRTELAASKTEDLVTNRENLKLYIFVVGGAVLVTLLFFIFSRLLRSSELKDSRFYYFPEVNVGERLGAPHGGGVIAEVRFTRR
ncbi:MAG: TPM domain-containing protein [Verrucomicrobiota bacterium]